MEIVLRVVVIQAASLALCWILVNSSGATTINVPGEYTTIQEGINASVDGDTVLVAGGTYTGSGNKDNDYGGKSIVVMSEDGAEATVIDCELDGRGFYFASGEDTLARLDGFTVMNGSDDYGGGIYCLDSKPTIANCIITKNAAVSSAGDGGGIYCSSSAVITNCIISENRTSAEWGGAGGGIYIKSSPIISYCSILNNSTSTDFNYNVGGGIYSGTDSSPTIISCIISGNSAGGLQGGGIFCAFGSSPTLANCIISENASVEEGAGIYCDYASPVFAYCTVSRNYGEGINCWWTSPYIINCIFWDNETEIYYYPDSEPPTILFSDFQGGWDGEGNINADPFFMDPENADFHIHPGSPCLNAAKDVDLSYDVDGDPRPDANGSGFDMGADEAELLGPVVRLSQYSFAIDGFLEGLIDNDTLNVDNIGVEELDYSVHSGETSWLRLSGDLETVLSPGESGSVILELDISGMNFGTYEDTLIV